jgi:hypothetical protein
MLVGSSPSPVVSVEDAVTGEPVDLSTSPSVAGERGSVHAFTDALSLVVERKKRAKLAVLPSPAAGKAEPRTIIATVMEVIPANGAPHGPATTDHAAVDGGESNEQPVQPTDSD